MITDVQPLATLAAVAVHGQVLARERVRDEQRQELLRILPRAVGVGAAGDQRVDTVGAHVGEHLQIAAGLRRRIRARRSHGCSLGARLVTERDVAVDLVGRHLQMANFMLTCVVE